MDTVSLIDIMALIDVMTVIDFYTHRYCFTVRHYGTDGCNYTLVVSAIDCLLSCFVFQELTCKLLLITLEIHTRKALLKLFLSYPTNPE